MRKVIDRNDTEWEVHEIAPDVGTARGSSQRLPDPVGATLVYTSHDRTVKMPTTPGEIDNMTDQELLELLEMYF